MDTSLDFVDEDAGTALQIDLSTTAKVNFASSQNGVSILQHLTLVNTGSVALEGLVVHASCQPGLIRPKTWTLDRLAPGDRQSIRDLETPLDTAILGMLNEAEWGEVSVRIDYDGAPRLTETRRIEMLARDEWGGLEDMSGLIAAFVQPNNATVAAILKDASGLLEQAGLSGAIDGYQSRDPARAWMLAGAIWSAATALGLSYAVPPASFEHRGQKIRDPGRMRTEGLATCLDSALLLAGCFEAAGLNPVVLFGEGHAWTGVWLTDRDFGSITEPDVMAVRKAIDAREFVTMETTLLCQRPTVGFDQAVEQGRDLTAERVEHTFAVAVDICRARSARIRPLAQHAAGEEIESRDIPASPAALPKPLDFGFLPDDLVEEAPKTAADRISRWQRKLLDLSLRNRLLNFRDSKQTLPFLCPDVASLEDQLAANGKFRTLALNDENPPGMAEAIARDEAQILEEVARDAFDKGQIAVPLTRRETDKRLLELHRRAKSDMQEGGTNTLFLAAGFLRWKKTETDGRSYRAPLLLIPVKISRRSAQSEFVIEHHEDDVRFNSTLLEFLKRDFDLSIPELEGDLPRDGVGYDLPRIFEILRRRVRDIAGFEVVEELALSTFSFAKFLMWKDLVDRTDDLRESPLVRYLVDNPTEPFLPDGSAGLPQPADIDRRVAPRDLFTPLPADSSQLSAVLAAQEGHDFVLIGPPGTGKSQTIANIIAQCIAVGKTVLFVAEKSAALDVVHRRLKAHGLADAVLELHSNKSDRKSVVSQLGRSWDRACDTTQADWHRVTDDLGITRQELNTYVAALHRTGSQGFSVYQAIGHSARLRPPFRLQFDNIDAHDTESYANLQRLAQSLARGQEIIATLPQFPLVGATDWSFAWQDAFLTAADALARATTDLVTAATSVVQLTGLRADPAQNREDLGKIAALGQITTTGQDVSWGLSQDMARLSQEVDDFIQLVADYHDSVAACAARYQMDRLETMPLDQLDADWRVAQTKLWPFSSLAQSSVRKLLQTYAVEGTADPARDITALSNARRARTKIEAHRLQACPACDGVKTDTATLSQWLVQAQDLYGVLRPLSPSVVERTRWEAACTSLATREAGEVARAVADLGAAHSEWSDAAAKFAQVAACDLAQISLSGLEKSLRTILANKEHLLEWTRWTELRTRARACGLSPLVEAIEDGRLQDDAGDAFAAAYAAWWLPLAMDGDEALRGFSHWAHEDAIKRFRELVDQATQMSSAQVLQRVQHGLPAQDMVARRSELGTLRHQMGLQRPSMPIRSLISEMPDTFTKLAPCVLMSPLSVAQYLPAGQAAFDVVIFDEASQITTWDAIGAIARGRQAIIVGDPKQLPPTNFFGRVDGGEEEVAENERDLASILDEVAAAGVPTRQLDWHYRSRDEALIAFSNWHYYGGRLVTFPSPTITSDAVQLHYVDGVYGRGQARTNVAEARAIVRMAVGRLKGWLKDPEADRLTLGVITFNAEQQGLILDLLDEERRQTPDLEWFFEDAREEPVIVKNLENIQGDERDVMLFSVTFGPDPAGKLSMAFGALNGEGGEKRLNVAVTRARRELHVFSSVRADQIDLGRTRAMGVKHLKGFLDYAARGAEALPAQDDGSLGPVENVFEAAIKTAIEAKGWELRPQIGVSGFRIDLGVVHPDHAGVYLAGIECDGASYHSSATARDRDKVRQVVLENLGWTILRIWSTDWFRNPKPVIERIHAALCDHLERDRAARAQRDSAADANNIPFDADAELAAPSGDTPASDAQEKDAHENDAVPRDMPARHAATGAQAMTSIPEGGVEGGDHTLAGDVVPCAPPATPYALHDASRAQAKTATPPPPDPARFYDLSYIPVLERLVADVAHAHAPLTFSQLAKQITAMHGWTRAGRRICEQIYDALALVEVHPEEGVDFIWTTGSYTDRLPFRAGLMRDVRDISRTEIAGLIEAHPDALTVATDPVRELARLAEVGRLSSDVRSYLEGCLRWQAETAHSPRGPEA
ncbi:DUF3320 domain-containing protein [Rhodobacteraceae bacterium]|nr:DUF3320 domain-containing protein [Paracoccaceae bacterium]